MEVGRIFKSKKKKKKAFLRNLNLIPVAPTVREGRRRMEKREVEEASHT